MSGSYHRRSLITVCNSVYIVLSKSTPNRFKENLSHALADFRRSSVSANSLIFKVLGVVSCFSASKRAMLHQCQQRKREPAASNLTCLEGFVRLEKSDSRMVTQLLAVALL